MAAVTDLAASVGVKPACAALGLPRSTWYRKRKPRLQAAAPRPRPPRSLDDDERKAVLRTLCEPRFGDRSPAEVAATLLDEGRYLCSERTMYRVLAADAPVRERRNQLRHPVYQKPELVATGPNEVWSWDITKLRGPEKWSHFYLYVLIDIFSRYVVGWMVAERETAALGSRLIDETCEKQGIAPGKLILHSDRGSPMTAKCTAQLLADLGLTRSLSRPHVSDDNPFSEAHFKTLKYHPSFPKRFASQQEALSWCRGFFGWYNDDHRRGGIALLTPADVHHGRVHAVLADRQTALDAAYQRNPERFVRGRPQVPLLPGKVWINKPLPTENDSFENAQ